MSSFWDLFNPTKYAGGDLNEIFDFTDPGNTFHQGYGDRLASDQWDWQKEKYQENFDYAKWWNQVQFDHQMDEYKYQMWLNQAQMAREDDAVQRRVADLKAAGLSPTLAAGSPASATPVHAASASSISPAQYEVGTNPKLQYQMFKEQMQKDRMALAMTLMGNIADVSKTKAETEFIKAQKDRYVQETPVDLAIKYQAYEFAQNVNPYKIKHAANEISLQDKDMALKDMDLILSEDVHAQNAYKIYSMYLDNELKQADIDIKDREFILKGLAIDAAMIANERAGLELKNLKWDTDYYHTRNMPVGMNFGMFNPLLGMSSWAGAAGEEAGKSIGGKLKTVVDFVKSWRDRFKVSAGDYHRRYDRY